MHLPESLGPIVMLWGSNWDRRGSDFINELKAEEFTIEPAIRRWLS